MALIKLIDILDTYLSLSQKYISHTYAIVDYVSNPKNLQLLIRLSVDTSPNIQLLAHRLLQNLLKFDLPIEVLD